MEWKFFWCFSSFSEDVTEMKLGVFADIKFIFRRKKGLLFPGQHTKHLKWRSGQPRVNPLPKKIPPPRMTPRPDERQFFEDRSKTSKIQLNMA